MVQYTENSNKGEEQWYSTQRTVMKERERGAVVQYTENSNERGRAFNVESINGEQQTVNTESGSG